MDLDGCLPLVSPLIAALAARPLSERLPPRTATRTLTALAAGLALSSMGTLWRWPMTGSPSGLYSRPASPAPSTRCSGRCEPCGRPGGMRASCPAMACSP
jgi:hypothetical protein